MGDGPNVYYSGKMIESTTFKDSVANGELVPQITLSPLADPKEEWGALEVASILTKVTAQWFNIGDSIGYDNNNPALWRMGSKEDPMYLATTDYPYPQRFDINTLDTLELLRPKNGMGTTGCAHWQREPGTDNSIVFAHKSAVVLEMILLKFIDIHLTI